MEVISRQIARYERWYRTQPWVVLALGALMAAVGLAMLQFNKIYMPHVTLIAYLNLLAVGFAVPGTAMVMHAGMFLLLRRWVE